MLNCDIGFIGLAGSGKDTAAEALTALGWRRMAFADRLKMLAFQFGWDGYKDDRGRKLLQDLGMAARGYNSDFWVDQAYNSLNSTQQGYANIPKVWTDVRFENEAEFVRKRGGIIIRIIRPDQHSSSSHESELNQYNISADYTVVNRGTIEDLHAMILNIIQ
jgi:hypothetical protein